MSASSLSHTARADWRAVAAGLTALCCEADQLSTPGGAGAYNATCWAPLVMGILRGLAAGPGRGGDRACQAAVTASSGEARSVFGDERFTDVTGDSSE